MRAFKPRSAALVPNTKVNKELGANAIDRASFSLSRLLAGEGRGGGRGGAVISTQEHLASRVRASHFEAGKAML